ncbi:MAG: hypothetical protein ACOCUW_03090, partial [Gemmatimonadota bacterium]
MTGTRPTPRPRPPLRSGAFFVVLAALAGAGAATAQEPDTARVRDPREGPPSLPSQDTVPADTVDSLPPPPGLPGLGPGGEPGWSRGVWEWSREDLLRLPDLSVLQLLERIPGVLPVRADLVNQPEAGAVFGAAAGAIRWVVDGFVLDPLMAPTFDPSRLSLLALERVRVERRVTGATVWLETLAPDDPRVKSVIEAGTGDYGINLFRGMFLAPEVLGGPVGAGFERLSSAGFVPGSSNHTVTWLKWTWARDSSGVQLEFRQSSIDREGVGERVVGSRADWVVRARRLLGPVTAEAYVGATTVDAEVGDEDATAVREGTPQGGGRLGVDLAAPVPWTAELAARFRNHPRLPAQELELRAAAAPLPWLTLEGDVLHAMWSGRRPTGRWSARAVLGFGIVVGFVSL